MDSLAIIGYAVRYPQEATDSMRFWDFLLKARESSTAFPEDRINSKAFYHPDPDHGGTFHTKRAHFLRESPIAFDAAFFKVSKAEVLSLDPLHRLVMENTYHAMENAGIPMADAISSNTSVFVNGYNHDHADNLNCDPENTLKYKPTGSENSLISGRLSWFYDFRGPSLTVETACSGSLVGLHLACQSLKAKECDMAVVSGVNVIGYLSHMIGMSYSGFMGSEGKCFAFDHRADGYSRGEGVGTVIVKRLSTAVEDGDTIRAVIRGTGWNQDGRTPGITYPGLASQQRLIEKTYHAAGLDTDETCYLESHGTGTQAGDWVEASAINCAFDSKKRDLPLYIGALKTNIGHLEGGSGIAGLIKTIIIMETGIIPPNANFEKPNQKIPIEEWKLSLPIKCEAWPTSKLRRASVSSFGLSGTNSHCILDDAYSFLRAHGISAKHKTRVGSPSDDEMQLIRDGIHYSVDDMRWGQDNEIFGSKSLMASTNGIGGKKGPPALVLLSGFDKASFTRVVSDLAVYVNAKRHSSSKNEGKFLDDFSFTLSQKRTRFNYTACILASSVPKLQSRLAEDSLVPHYWRGVPRLGFVFTGQGVQYPGMGRQLLVYPVFRKSLEAAERYFQSLGSDWLLLEELDRDKDKTTISQPAVAHPSSTAIQIALVDLLASWGISPTRVVGHSSGEVAAAYCAGKISRQAALRLAFFRGQVTGGSLTPPGSMMAVGLSADELQPLLEDVQEKYPDGTLGIACFNSPKNQTVSGDSAMVDALKSMLDTKRVFARKLNIEKAYHSEHMKSTSESYQASVGSLEKGELPNSGQSIAMFSTFTGEEIVDAPLYPSYWCASLVGAVKFEQALQALCYTPSKEQCLANGVEEMSPQIDELVEIGSHGALRSAIKETINTTQAITYHPTLDRANPSTEVLLRSVADLASKGFPVNILAVNNADGHCEDPAMLVDLPPYPFNHENKDIYESRLAKNYRLRKYPRHDMFGAPVADFDPRYPKWRHFLRLHENPWLRQHKIDERYVFPPAGYIAMAIESSMQMAEKHRSVKGIHLERINFGQLLAIPDDPQGIELSLSHHENDTSEWARFQVSSYSESQSCWTQHCTADVSIEYDEDNKTAGLDLEYEQKTNGQGGRLSHFKNSCESSMTFDDMCKRLSSCGLELGSIYQTLSPIGMSGHGEGTSTAVIEVPDISSIMPKGYMHPHLLHPVTLNNLLLPAAAAVYDLHDSLDMGIFMPSFIERTWVSTKSSYSPHSQFDCVGTASVTGRDKYRCNIEVVHEQSSESAISFNGVHLGLYETEGRLSKAEALPHFYSVEWKPDIHLLTNSFFDQLVQQSTSSKVQYKSESEWFTDLQLASTLLSTDALLHLKGVDLSGLERHYIRFYDLLKHIAADVLTDSIPNVPFKTWKKYAHDPGLKESLYRKVEARDSDGALLIRVGSRIPSFFRKELDPLYIMFGQDDLMTAYYKSDFEIGKISEKLGHFLDLFRWNRSNLRVLEVGGGTGSFTANALCHLCPPDMDRSVSEYVFTDISAGFFEKAKQSLRDWSDIMAYKKFDVGSDPISQGFEPGTFDLIVASNVLHATPDLHQTLKNIRCLLKPGGKLAVHEGVRQDTLWTNLSFSPLSGWWLSTEPERRWCPYIPTETWDKYLCETGFSGLDLEFPSSNITEFSKISLMVSTAEGDVAPNVVKDVAIVVDEGGSPLAQDFRSQIEQLGFSASMGEAKEIEAADLSHKICVIFVSSTPRDSGARTYESVQSILSRSNNALLITGDSSKNPLFDTPVGLIRHRRFEQGFDANLVAVSVVDAEFPEAICKSLVDIFKHQFCSHAVSAKNAEYRLEQGVVLTNRVTPNVDANVTIRGRLSAPEAVAVQWGDIGRPVKLISDGRLGLDADSLLPDHPICDDDVDLDVSAVGLGFRDLLVTNGELPQRTLGQEASGVVTKVGSAVKHIQPGDRVMCISDTQAGREGTLRTALRVNSSLVTRIPPDLSFEAAAGLSISCLTAIYALKHIGRLVAGEKILIHAAGSGVGQAAIQYAQASGAEVFVTVPDRNERDYISLEYGLEHDHIFSGRSTSLRNQANRRVPGGMDVILSSSAETIRTSLNCMAAFGRLIDISHGSHRTHNLYTSSTDNITVAKVDINSLARSRPATVQQLFRDMIELVEANKIRPQSSTNVLPYSEINNAIEMMQDTAGQIVLRPYNDDSVQVIPEISPPSPLDDNASYLLIGALEPLQYKLALHMAGRGAKDLILLSRSPSLDSEDTQQVLSHLRARGCRAHLYHCNIAQESVLQSLVSSWHSKLPPVKGIVKSAYQSDCHAGLSLQSEKHPNGTSAETTGGPYDEISELLNIHNTFSSVDFLVMISSITESTLKHDSSLKAAEALQDALAHHRLASGLHAASFHVGDMKEEEILAAIDYMTEHQGPAQNHCPLIGNPPTPSLYQDTQGPIPEYLLDPLFSQLPISRSRETTVTETQQRPSVGDLLKKTNSAEQGKVVVMGEVRRKLSNLLNVSEDEIDEKADVRRNGVDSLIEMEFRDWMNKELRVTVSPEDMTRKDISTLSEHVVVESPLVSFS